MTGSFLRNKALRIIGCATLGFTLSIVFAPAAEANGGVTYVGGSVDCARVVIGKVVLTADIICTDSDGLVVGADNTKIYLNGFSIKCMDPVDGYKFSCQGGDSLAGPGDNNADDDTGPARSYRDIGLDSGGFSNVEFQGPGQVLGFDAGAFLDGVGPCHRASNIRVKKINVTGPDGRSDILPWPTPRPAQVFGILAQDFVDSSCTCSNWSNDDGHWHGVEIHGNMVENHTIGIALYRSSRVKVHMNFVHDINSANEAPADTSDPSQFVFQTAGIVVCAHTAARPAPHCSELDATNQPLPSVAEKNLISQNLVVDIGQNFPDANNPDTGLLLRGNAVFNRVIQNSVLANNGDGISLQNGPASNQIIKNVALYNSTTNTTLVDPFTSQNVVFADIASRGAETNVIKENNDCLTEFGIVGVCAPDENQAWQTAGP